LDGPGIKFQWGRDFLHLSRPALEPAQPQAEVVSVPQTSDNQTDSQTEDVSVLQVSDNQTDKQAPDISVTQVSNNSTETTIPQQTGSKTDQTDPLPQAKVPNRKSSRQKKPTQTKSDDFLW